MEKIIVITAFGAFGDIEKNPTQEIVEELRVSQQEIGFNLEKDALELKIPILYYIIPVSVEDCLQVMAKIQADINEKCLNSAAKEVYMFHLGVDGRAVTMKLEQFGYNNMSFRIPDIRGYQPENLCINDLCSLNGTFSTSFNLRHGLQLFQNERPDLAFFVTAKCNSSQLKGESVNTATDRVFENNFVVSMSDSATSSPTVVLSTDPGRYLCNYLYYQSLSFSSQCVEKTIHSLFIHVPPFSAIPKHLQIDILLVLINTFLKEEAVRSRNSQV